MSDEKDLRSAYIKKAVRGVIKMCTEYSERWDKLCGFLGYTRVPITDNGGTVTR